MSLHKCINISIWYVDSQKSNCLQSSIFKKFEWQIGSQNVFNNISSAQFPILLPKLGNTNLLKNFSNDQGEEKYLILMIFY